VEPGLPARREWRNAISSRWIILEGVGKFGRFSGRQDAALYVRQGCLTLRAAVVAGLWPAVEPGFQPGGNDATQFRAGGLFWRVWESLGVFSGRQDAALYVRQGCLTLHNNKWK
jgi:hypothetical protein